MDDRLIEALAARGYAVLRELGRGGMGVVLLARQLALDREVAVKCLLPEATDDPVFWKRFVAESAMFRTLSHPNVVRVFDVHLEPPFPFIVLELVRGMGPLDRVLEERRLPAERSSSILLGILRALDHIHSKDIAHRDLKPGNVLLTAEWEPKLIDFGLARCLSSEQTRATRDGHVIGTFAYMAPEQMTAQETTTAADVYAWALIAYEVFAGELIFSARSRAVSPEKRLVGRIPALSTFRPDVERRIEHIVTNCLAVSPELRPQTAGAVLAALKGRSTGEDATQPLNPVRAARAPRKESDGPRAGRTGQSRAAVAPVDPGTQRRLAIAVATVGLVGAFALWRHTSGPSPAAPKPITRSPLIASPTTHVPTADDMGRLRMFVNVLRPLSFESVFRRAREFTAARRETGGQRPATSSLLPAGVMLAFRSAAPHLGAALPDLSSDPLQLELMNQLYLLELLDVFLDERGFEPASGVARYLPQGWAEQAHRNASEHPDWPPHRFNRLGPPTKELSPAESTLNGGALQLEQFTQYPAWDVLQWSINFTGSKQSGAKPDARLDWSLPATSLKDRRAVMWMADSTADGMGVLWFDVNGKLRVPFCRQGPPVAPGKPNLPVHVRVTPCQAFHSGRNAIRISWESYPGLDRPKAQYLGFARLVFFDRTPP